MKEPKKVEMWVNAYQTSPGRPEAGTIHPSYEKARKMKDRWGYIGTFQLVKFKKKVKK